MTPVPDTPSDPDVSFSRLAVVFGRIGVLSFGGPAAQIGLMHRELVDGTGWLREKEFLSALSFCMLLPGPEAMQLATYAGWRLRGVAGGLIGGGLFVLPGALVIAVLALGYASFGDAPLVMAAFLGIKATVVVVVLQALWRLRNKSLTGPGAWTIAAATLAALVLFDPPFPAIVALAATWGYFGTPRPATPPAPVAPVTGTGRRVLIWGALWLVPLAALMALDGGFLTDLALFFSKLAVVTFGGAYAVLAYMTQEVVSNHGWIGTAEMMDGLGLAETTPGPLILVTQFVGMLAGAAQGGPGLAVVAGAIVLWMTFVPCFMWIFVGAPYLAWLTAQARLAGALSAVMAAVVGVIANLALWFAAHVFFADVGQTRIGPAQILAPRLDSFDPAAALLCAFAGALLFWRGLPLPVVLALSAAAGAGLRLVV